jgi:hypothetical protein
MLVSDRARDCRARLRFGGWPPEAGSAWPKFGRSVLQFGDFFFYSEFFALQSAESQAIRLWAVDFVVDFVFQVSVLLIQAFEMRLNRHSRLSVTVL